MDLVWNHWTERTTEKRPYATDNDEEEERHVLRSTYQRFSAASMLFIAGCFGTATGLFMRSQYVLAMGILPKSSGVERSVFLQTYRTGQHQGFRIPMSKTQLGPGKKPRELVLAVQGKAYPWYLPFEKDVVINGTKMSPHDATRTITETWGTKYIDRKLLKVANAKPQRNNTQ